MNTAVDRAVFLILVRGDGGDVNVSGIDQVAGGFAKFRRDGVIRGGCWRRWRFG